MSIPTRRDFIEAATIAGKSPSPMVRRQITNAMVQFFSSRNPRFDESRFREYVERIAASLDALHRED